MLRHRTLALAGLLGWLVAAAACSDDSASSGTGGSGANNTGAGGSGAGNTGGNGTGGAGNTGGNGTGGLGEGGGFIPPPPTEIVECQNQVYECGNLIDDDMDGLMDYQDPDCLGPCDNTEDSYFGGIPGQSGPACIVDCYFDSNSGAGNDDCHWTHECDPNSVDPNYYPEPANGSACEYDPMASYPGSGEDCAEMDAAQSDQCMNVCGPLTPNGCDCFGCCELPAGGGQYVWLGSEGFDSQNPTVCTADKLNDPTVCHPCKPVTACLNDCGPCEVCIGKPLPDPGCFPGEGGGGQGGSAGQGGSPPTGQCEPGVQACGLPGQEPCPSGFYCITGCCQFTPQ